MILVCPRKVSVPAKTFCSRIGGQLSLSSTTSKKQSRVRSEVLPQKKVNDLIINFIISEFRPLITVEKLLLVVEILSLTMVQTLSKDLMNAKMIAILMIVKM